MTNEDVLNRSRTFRAVKLQPVRSYRYERRLSLSRRTCHERRTWASFQFSATLGGDSFTSVRLQDKNSAAMDSGRPLYHCGPFPACVGKVFEHIFDTNIIFSNM